MTDKQLAILNSLIAYTANNIPRELSDEEQEVVQIVRGWMSKDLIRQMAHKTHVYKTVNASTGRTEADVANRWAEHGWRVVAVISDTRPGFAHALMLERPVGMTHPFD